MSNPADAYLAARAEFEVVHTQLMDIATAIDSVAAALRSAPGAVMFSNLPGGRPPETPRGGRSKSFDARQWPSAEQIQRLLISWHAARDKMMAAWAAISDPVRAGLQPPPAAAQ
jgi:hypothetical protein